MNIHPTILPQTTSGIFYQACRRGSIPVRYHPRNGEGDGVEARDAMKATSDTESPLVSVVVPFYNVEDYAEACLASLAAQTFERCEILCIDDGSTDDTPQILARFADADPRIRVHRIEHAGLSVARNCGVELARAELVSFVDGDDVVSPYYLQLLYDAHGGVPGRMVAGNARRLGKDEVTPIEWQSTPRRTRTVSPHEAIREYLRWELGQAAWGRLASRDLYLRIPFEPGVLYEDSYAFSSHLSAVDEIVLLDVELYGYTLRVGSLSNPRFVTPAHVDGMLRTAGSISETALSWPLELRRLAIWRLDRHLLWIVKMSTQLSDREFARAYCSVARHALAKDLPWLLKARRKEHLSWQLPAASVIAIVSPRLLYAVDRIRKRL